MKQKRITLKSLIKYAKKGRWDIICFALETIEDELKKENIKLKNWPLFGTWLSKEFPDKLPRKFHKDFK